MLHSSSGPTTPKTARLVRVRDVESRVIVRLRYATADNFTGRRLYLANEAWLREETAWKLRRAQDGLIRRGLNLKILDAYRPPSAQRAMWDCCPDERFVAPPERGSRHTRGAAVDVTLVDASGADVEMPSAHDEFGERSARDWAGASELAARHREWLQAAMTGAGFTTVSSEWWHFDDGDWRRYPLLSFEFVDLDGHADISGLPSGNVPR